MLNALIDSVLFDARERTDELLNDILKIEIKSRTALTGVLYHIFSSPEISLVDLTPSGRGRVQPKVGQMNMPLVVMLVDSVTNENDDFDTKEALDKAFGMVKTAAALSESLSTSQKRLRWQDVLTHILNDEGTMELIDALTVDGNMVTELIVAALTGEDN